MVKEDLLLRSQNSPPIEHHQRSVCWNNDANLMYIRISDVVLNWQDISRWDGNPHPLLGMCPPPLL